MRRGARITNPRQFRRAVGWWSLALAWIAGRA